MAGILIHLLLVVTLLILSVWAKKMMARNIENAPVIFEFLVKPDRTGRYPQQLQSTSATCQSLAVVRRFSCSSNLQTCVKPSRLSLSSRLRRVRISIPMVAAITKPAADKRIKVRANIQYLNSVAERYIHTNLLDRGDTVLAVFAFSKLGMKSLNLVTAG